MAEGRSRGRRPLLLAASFAAGLAAGFLLGRIAAEPAPVPPAVEAPQPGPPPRRDASPSPAPPADASASPSVVEAPAALPSAPSAGGPLTEIDGPAKEVAAAWVEVTVRTAEGTASADGGTVYALPAGEPGADEYEAVPHAEYEPPGPARIPLPAGGEWDIGFSTNLVAAVHPGVSVPPGETVPVAIDLPETAPIRLVCPGWPPVSVRPVQGRVQVASLGEGDRHGLPGRDERLGFVLSVPIRGDGTALSWPLPLQGTYRVSAILQEAVEKAGKRRQWVNSSLAYLEPDRTEVPAGSLVTLRLRRYATLEVLPEPDGGTWPDEVRKVHFRWEQAGRSIHGPAGRGNDSVMAAATILGVAGSGTLRWSGTGILPGSRSLTLAEGETRKVEIPVTFGEAPPTAEPEPAEPEPLFLRFTGFPGTVSDLGDIFLYTVPRDPRVEPRTPDGIYNDDATVRLDGDVRGERLMAFTDHGMASAPVEAPLSGPMAVELLAGGRLVVVPDRQYPEELGTLLLRRSDGLPIVVQGEGVYRDAPVRAGTLLGPFPPGTIRFEVVLGRKKVGTASAVVEAGRNTPLLVGR